MRRWSGTVCCSSPGTSTCSPASSSARSASRRSSSGWEPRPDLSWTRVADEAEAIYTELADLRRPVEPLKPAVRERLAAPDDRRRHPHAHRLLERLVTPVEVLLATAGERGSGASGVTHNEISGALDARDKAAEFGVKVIVGEEVKTKDQGEVIGLFIEEKIARGMSLEETIAEIRRQGGLVVRPRPVRPPPLGPRLRDAWGRRRPGRRDRGLQPADRDRRLERGGGRFAGSIHPRWRPAGRPRRAGPRRRAHPDARLRRAGGVPRSLRDQTSSGARRRCATRRSRR